MYYNKTQKDRYLSTLSAQTAKDACKYIFNQAFERENMLALDLALWPRSEVIRFVEVLAGLDADSTKKRIDRIMDYQYWSASTSSNYVQLEEETPAFLNGEISVDEIDITDVIRENLYPSFSSVIQKVKMVLPDQPGYVIFPLIAFAWLNIPKKIMGQIPRDGVDFEQHTIVDEDGHILIHAIPAEIEQVLYSYITTKEGRKGNARVFPLENGKFLRLMEPLGTKKIPKPFSPMKDFFSSSKFFISSMNISFRLNLNASSQRYLRTLFANLSVSITPS